MSLFTEESTLEGHTAPVRVVKWNSNGQYCLSGGYDKLIKLWNPFQKRLIKTFKGHGYQVMDIAVAFDNGSFISGGGDKTPFLWDVASGQVVRKVRGHEQMINSVCFNSDASVFASASYDQTAKVWDGRSRSMEPIQVLEGAKDSVTTVYLDESEILTTSVDGCFRTYDLRMGQLRTDHLGSPVASLSISPCGTQVLLSCLDGTIKLLDRHDGSLVHNLTGHTNTEFKMDSTFTHKGKYAISGSEDGRLCAWNVDSGKAIESVSAHSRMVSGVSIHPGVGEYLLTSSNDTLIKLWAVKSGV